MENSTEVKRSNNRVEVEWTCPVRLGRTVARYKSVRSRSNKNNVGRAGFQVQSQDYELGGGAIRII